MPPAARDLARSLCDASGGQGPGVFVV